MLRSPPGDSPGPAGREGRGGGPALPRCRAEEGERDNHHPAPAPARGGRGGKVGFFFF